MSVMITVVIPTYQRPELLSRCLQALAKQVYPTDLYDVVVVDDGRDAATRAVVDAFNQHFKGAPAFHYVQPLGTRGPAAARNRGWRTTQAPLIAFTDDDTEPMPNWLHEGSLAMTQDVSAAGGRLIVPVPSHPSDHERNTQGLENAEFATANAFVWRSALEKIGGFDERFTRAWREDSDLQFMLMRQCGPVVWAAKAVVVHPVRDVPWGFSLKTQKNVFFDALLYKKHPRLYRTKINPGSPWRYYLIVASAVLAVALWSLGWPRAALVLGLLAWFGVMRFALKRLHNASHTPAHVAEMLLTSLLIPFLAIYWRVRGAIHFKVMFI